MLQILEAIRSVLWAFGKSTSYWRFGLAYSARKEGGGWTGMHTVYEYDGMLSRPVYRPPKGREHLTKETRWNSNVVLRGLVLGFWRNSTCSSTIVQCHIGGRRLVLQRLDMIFPRLFGAC